MKDDEITEMERRALGSIYVWVRRIRPPLLRDHVHLLWWKFHFHKSWAHYRLHLRRLRKEGRL